MMNLGTKTKNLKQMYSDLKDGETVKCNGCTIWRSEPYTHYGSGKPQKRPGYLHWQHYGRSANRVSLNDLRWILNVIAESPDFAYEIV